MKKLIKKGIYFSLICLLPVAFAKVGETPVVDVTQDITQQQGQASTAPVAQYHLIKPTVTLPTTTNQASSQGQELSLQQRVMRLETQIANITRMNLPQEIANLQQSVEQLRGVLQVQSHDLKTLSSQQRSFYQDLDQRINQLRIRVGVKASTASNQNHEVKMSSQTMASTNHQINDSRAYKSAFDLLMKKQYSQSKTAFQKYLDSYPNGQFVVNAHYWLGEIYFLQKNNPMAIKEFSTVINKFPKSNKTSDAKLKIAIIFANTGKVAQARQQLMQIKQRYPGTTAAQLATIRLQQLSSAANGG